MRLIDADALKAEWAEPTDWMDRDQVLCHITWFRAVIDNMPTIDPVVRCKDCRYYGDKHYCSHIGVPVYDDFFCKDGEAAE